MIENVNASKNPATGDFLDIKKYIGVASVNVVAVNPSNDTLRSYGWSIPEDAEEPKYVVSSEQNGKIVKSARVRFLVQIKDLEDKPVISLDYWCRPEISSNKNGDKFKIIDAFGRTAWGTKDEIQGKRVPQYASGPANIATPYKLCHSGEEELVQFLMKYLNVTPLQVFDRNRQAWQNTKNPGRLTIDDWNAICNGNISEIARYLALQPDNRVKVVLGIRNTEDNKTYQTFLNTTYIGNGAVPDKATGEYAAARKAIDKYFESRSDSPYSFSAAPVIEWKETASEVKDNSSESFDFSNTIVSDDLPFS